MTLPSSPPSAAKSTPATPATDSSQAQKSLVLQGTGNLIGTPAAQPQPGIRSNHNGFQLNFTNTDISTVATAILSEGLGHPVVIGPDVQGTLTLQASQPLSADQVTTALESALRDKGFVLLEVDGIYHVVPAAQATRRIPGLLVPGSGKHGFGVYVVPLKYVSAEDMRKTLAPFLPEDALIQVSTARNLLILSGTDQEIATLMNVVKTFDVNWLAGMSFALYPVEYSDLQTLIDELNEVFASPKSPIDGMVRLVPLKTINSILVVTPQAKYLPAVQSWIRRLDVGSTTPGRRIYVYNVQNGRADELAQSLDEILSLSPPSLSLQRGPGLGSLGGMSSGVGSAAPQLGYSSGEAGSTSAGSQLTLPATTGQGPLETQAASVSTPGDTGASRPGALRIVPDDDQNSLLIYATPGEFQSIHAALERLDVAPLEVLIDASVVEVTLNDELQYGVQFAYQSSKGPVVLSQSSAGSIAAQFPGFSFLYTGTKDIQAVLNALESITNVRVLSSPKLVVLNNREADLDVGDQVPIVSQSAVSTETPGAPIVNSVQMLSTGVILHVVPHANRGGQVSMDIDQEVSDVVPTTTSSINSPTVEQRMISTTVSVRDGETVALGGLIEDSRSRTRTGIPFLRRLPIIGNLFGSDDHNTSRTELLVLLTPHLLRSQSESDAVMENLRDQFVALRHLLPHWNDGTKREHADASHKAPSPPR
ncbi:MAG: type II secretion system secretin GspD [Steroidobacteraceae bacterium]